MHNEAMELLLIGVFAFFVVYLFAYPSWRRWELARDAKRNRRVIPMGGLDAPIDEVFHPSAHEANLIWAAEKVVPAPAPNADGNRPDLDSGRITISVDSDTRTEICPATMVRADLTIRKRTDNIRRDPFENRGAQGTPVHRVRAVETH
jgi:hypothetical protein